MAKVTKKSVMKKKEAMKTAKKKLVTEKVKGKYAKLQSGKNKSVGKDSLTQAREDLALCYRLCNHFNFNEGVCNHLSFEIQGEEKFMLIKYGVHWSQAKMSDILVLNFDGDVLVGDGKPEITGFYSHRALHKAFGAPAACVLHTHQPWITTLMALKPECGGNLLPIQQGFLRFDGWTAYDNVWGGLFDADTSDTMTQAALKFRDETGRCPRVMCSRNHGVFGLGASIQEAWDNLYYVERLAEVQVRALSCVGGDLSKLEYISDDALKRFPPTGPAGRKVEIDAHWEAMRGMMADAKPDYRK